MFPLHTRFRAAPGDLGCSVAYYSGLYCLAWGVCEKYEEYLSSTLTIDMEPGEYFTNVLSSVSQHYFSCGYVTDFWTRIITQTYNMNITNPESLPGYLGNTSRKLRLYGDRKDRSSILNPPEMVYGSSGVLRPPQQPLRRRNPRPWKPPQLLRFRDTICW